MAGMLKQIAPAVTRVGVLRDPALAVGAGQYGAIQSVAPSLAMEASPINLRDAGEIERGIANFARVPNGGLILTGGALGIVHRDLIVTLAARYNLPAVYIDRYFAEGGGLISYGPDFDRRLSAHGGLCGSHPQGRQTGKSAGPTPGQV